MEYWNDEERRRKTKNLFFPDFNTRYSPFQQSNIPIPQKITLRDDFKPFFPGTKKGVGRLGMNPWIRPNGLEYGGGFFLKP